MRLDFEDGTRLEQDSRGEDPLIYFVPSVGWSQAVGFLALPEYREHQATSVTLQVYAGHEARLAVRDVTELRALVSHLAGGLIRLFGHWKELLVDWPPWLIDRLGADTVVGLFRGAGWQPRDVSPGGPLTFVRGRDPASVEA